MTVDHRAVRRDVEEAVKRAVAGIGEPYQTQALCRPVYQAVQGVGWLESRYGTAWNSAEARASNNVGCVQASKPPCDPATSFQSIDTHPNPDGTSTVYHICFKKYKTRADGFYDVARIMLRAVKGGSRPVLDAAIRGDLYGVSAAMRTAIHYYEGHGRTTAERIQNHYRALVDAVKRQAQALNEPMPDGSFPPPQTIKRGSRGEDVKDWQRMLGLAADGVFGPATEKATKDWQEEHGLKPDGVVGPKTWLLAQSNHPTDPVFLAVTQEGILAREAADTEPPEPPEAA